jgi:hypothetical protein
LSDDPQTRIAQAWNEAVDRHIAGLSDTDLADLLSRTRPQAAPAAPAPAPLTAYEIAQAQNTRRREALRSKVHQLTNIPTGRNGALSMPADSGMAPSEAGAPELPEPAAPPPQQPRPSLTPLGLTPTTRTTGPRSRVGLEPRPGLQVQ